MPFSRNFAMDSISVLLLKYLKVLYFTNLVCTTKFLKYKSLEKFPAIQYVASSVVQGCAGNPLNTLQSVLKDFF